ncbi:hypothetical protein HMPREF9997_01935 [Corynebacterium durum F0235]|uniref:Uncharacterized protein n=1 Tax=Corynebacterium durum F0235 TaxID=1035195 RepID=L1MET3_9CORY|nr:hypothetical protein HMPREF9997_01935 [Corynebacterium durum F0235]
MLRILAKTLSQKSQKLWVKLLDRLGDLWCSIQTTNCRSHIR